MHAYHKSEETTVEFVCVAFGEFLKKLPGAIPEILTGFWDLLSKNPPLNLQLYQRLVKI